MIVDKWFVDTGCGLRRSPSGGIVFIQSSAVQGAEVLTIGTDAWVQVANDDAGTQGRYRAGRAWGWDVWEAERDKERAKKVAQQVRRVAAQKVSVVGDQPPGLRGELAEHNEAPNMWAGGSHPGLNDAGPVGHKQLSLRKREPRHDLCFVRRTAASVQTQGRSLQRVGFVEFEHSQPRELHEHHNNSRIRGERSCSKEHVKTRMKRGNSSKDNRVPGRGTEQSSRKSSDGK